MPKLWKDTVAEHRRDVRAAIHDAAWQLAQERGVLGVTMGSVAERAGIGRATLYKYFGGVEEILLAAHSAHVDEHLSSLTVLLATSDTPTEGLARLLNGYARICFHRGRSGTPDLHILLHTGDQHRSREQQLLALFADAVRGAQKAGDVRVDVKAEELAGYCIHALEAAVGLPSQAALDRLVGLVYASLHQG